ncbi:MAG: hypothetical protein ABS75_25685 [Pelagibacterium sp. SCN 63-23]|nr:MAG: hypothetical protein ABS75_25685 [Pelagibacterium sp. SCN 63-23]
MPFSLKAAAAALTLTLAAGPVTAAEPVSVTLDWTPNTNFVGLYVAEALGLYAAAGLEVSIAPFEFGQPSGDVAAFGVLDFYAARAAGLDATGIYAVIRSETGRLAYRGDDIAGPRDLAGKTYGGFGTSWETAVIDTMIAHDGGTPNYEAATLQGSVYDALRAGAVDFTLEVLTWQGVENALAGNDVKSFRYADFGVPDQHTIILAADSAFLAERPEVAQAFVAATRAGYLHAVTNPQQAAEMLMTAAPELAAQEALVEASMQVMVEGNYLVSAEGEAGRFDEKLMSELGDFLFAAGALIGAEGEVLTEKPDISGWYTNQYVDRSSAASR